MSEILEHDAWCHEPAKSPAQPKITLGEIYGVDPFNGVRNPGSRSATSHRVWMTYRTPANDWRPQVGIFESAAEAAVAHEVLISRDLWDIQCQPLTVVYRDEDGARREYTHDNLLTFSDGYRRLVFVRNEASLAKPRTKRDIQAIAAATPREIANDMIIVNANDYSRQRRENLFRMHELCQDPDEEADDIVLGSARRYPPFQMRDIFARIALDQSRAFRACYRLIGRGLLLANMDNVIWEYSQVEVAA